MIWKPDICGYIYYAEYAALCKRDVGYARGVNGKYYKVIHTMNVNYGQAKAACKADGTRLATAPYGKLDKLAMERYVLPLTAVVMYDNLDPTIYGYWVDGSDDAVEGMWKLPDGV